MGGGAPQSRWRPQFGEDRAAWAQPEPPPASGGRVGDTFRVVFQAVPPRPSWTAWRRKSFGTLSVTADHARFVPRRGEPVLIEDVFRVSQGWRQSSGGVPIPAAIDTYIEV